MNQCQLFSVYLRVFFGSVGHVPLPNQHHKQTQKPGKIKGRAPAPLLHDPGDEGRSECPSNADTHHHEAAADPAVIGADPIRDDLIIIGGVRRLTHTHKKAHDHE